MVVGGFRNDLRTLTVLYGVYEVCGNGSTTELARDIMTENNDNAEDAAALEHYVLTDGDGSPIEGERYSDSDRAIDARARLMAEHPDGDAVTVEVLD